MSWRERYTEIMVGDMVELIDYHTSCDGQDCCNSNDYYVGQKYEVSEINGNGYHLRKTSGDKGCHFPKSCIRKVFTVQ